MVNNHARADDVLFIVFASNEPWLALAALAIARLRQQRRHVEIPLLDRRDVVSTATVTAYPPCQHLSHENMLGQRDVDYASYRLRA